MAVQNSHKRVVLAPAAKFSFSWLPTPWLWTLWLCSLQMHSGPNPHRQPALHGDFLLCCFRSVMSDCWWCLDSSIWLVCCWVSFTTVPCGASVLHPTTEKCLHVQFGSWSPTQWIATTWQHQWRDNDIGDGFLPNLVCIHDVADSTCFPYFTSLDFEGGVLLGSTSGYFVGVRFGNTSGYFKCDCKLFFFFFLFLFVFF